MHIPSATYRLQFNSSFGFKAAEGIVDYLARLGITTVYASPIFKARKGSTHGYDVVDPNQLNPEVGTREEFDALVEKLHARGLRWLQDFVPNHMAYDSANAILMDIFERGTGSDYHGFFDVVWDHLRENLRGKLIAPFLGSPYGETLEKKELALEYNEAGFSIRYYETVYPLRIESYSKIVEHDLDSFKERLGEDHADYVKMLGILQVFKGLEAEQPATETGALSARNAQVSLAKDLLWNAARESRGVREFIEASVARFNRDVDMLDDLLLEQWFRLSFWRVATKEINYQRFFNINELISLRMEDDAVFHFIHGLVFDLVKEGRIDGLRIDHVDGLYDPTRYLRQLREELPDAYIVVEKILELSEELPRRWPVQGTTGYDFMNYVNELFCDSSGEDRFQKIYADFAGAAADYMAMLVEKKKLVIERHLTGDLDNLTYVLKKISITSRDGIDLTWIGLKRALVEMVAFFPIYRTYVDSPYMTERDKRYVEEAVERAKEGNPELARELDFIELVLWMNYPERLTESEKSLWLSFVMRFQQFTSPLMAKGLEDTTFYVYNRMVSLNEVGGDPGCFGISPDRFHDFLEARAERFPYTLNATATHDTKRGEDVRARINVLSEIPDEWEKKLLVWHEMNREFKREARNEAAPSKNREYFLYQTLVGAFPFDGQVSDEFTQRIKDYMIKAAREAKIHTFWLDPNEEYEAALLDFVEWILRRSPDNQFLSDFAKFHKKIAHYGVFNSLSQALLKLTAPGVPDFYQGTEIWDFNLVDPDNRRAVDYLRRSDYLNEMIERGQSNLPSLINDLLSTLADGRVKLFTIYKALEARRDNRELFERGDYARLKADGAASDHAIAFARRLGKQCAITVAPRLPASLIKPGELPLGRKVWQDARLCLPEDAPATMRNVFTGQAVETRNGVSIAEALAQFPVAILIGE